jgi:hypothetical protein
LKICFTKQVSSVLGAISVIGLLSSVMSEQVYGQQVEQDFLCQRFSLNSRCEGNTSITQNKRANSGQRQPTHSENEANQIIKVRLRLSGPDNEWIWIKTSNNGAGGTVLTTYHTKRVRQTLLSNLATGLLSFGAEELASEAIDGYDGPVPVPDINFYRWANHETRRILFVPVGCSNNSPTSLGNERQLGQSNCVITGTTSITLPAGIDIRLGLLTIEYAEQDLVRTITFKVNPDRS